MPLPVERAAQVYARESCPRTFTEDLELHLLYGYVFATPSYFIMGRAVCSTAPHEDIVNPVIIFPRHQQDTWHIYLCAGTAPLRSFLDIEPYPLPNVSWERDNKLRIYSKEKVKQRLLSY